MPSESDATLAIDDVLGTDDLAMDDMEEDDGIEDVASEEKLGAASEAIAALQSGDAEALSAALERHYRACTGDIGEDDGDDEMME